MISDAYPRRVTFRFFLFALLWIASGWIGLFSDSMAGDAAAHDRGDETIKAGPTTTVPLEHPVIRALELTLTSRTRISAVTGTIYLTRRGKSLKNPVIGSEIRPGDLLQLTDKSSVSLRNAAGHTITLTDRSGQWYKFVERNARTQY